MLVAPGELGGNLTHLPGGNALDYLASTPRVELDGDVGEEGCRQVGGDVDGFRGREQSGDASAEQCAQRPAGDRRPKRRRQNPAGQGQLMEAVSVALEELVGRELAQGAQVLGCRAGAPA
jgi:hypothetical protein